MKIAQIQRELHGEVHPRVIYWLAHQQEQLMAMQQQLDQAASVIAKLVETMQNITKLHDIHDRALRQMFRSDGGLVESVLPDDEDTH